MSGSRWTGSVDASGAMYSLGRAAFAREGGDVGQAIVISQDLITISANQLAILPPRRAGEPLRPLLQQRVDEIAT